MDAGPLYAYVDADDRHHSESLELLLHYPGPLIVPVLVVTEVAYLIGTQLGGHAEVCFLGDLAAGDFLVEGVVAGDWLRIAELVGRYRNLPLEPSTARSSQPRNVSESPRSQHGTGDTFPSSVPPTQTRFSYSPETYRTPITKCGARMPIPPSTRDQHILERAQQRGSAASPIATKEVEHGLTP